MRYRFHLRILGEIGAAMARRTQTRQAAVVHGRWVPGHETTDVTGIALGDARNVIDRTCQGIGKKIRPVVTA